MKILSEYSVLETRIIGTKPKEIRLKICRDDSFARHFWLNKKQVEQLHRELGRVLGKMGAK